MKKRISILCLCVCALCCLFASEALSSTYNHTLLWAPIQNSVDNDTYSYVYDVNLVFGGTYGLYNPNTGEWSAGFGTGASTLVFVKDSVTGHWAVGFNTDQNTDTIESMIFTDLGLNAHFGVYFKTGSTEVSYTIAGSPGNYTLSSSAGSVLKFSAQPVPIPAAGVLFGSGLLGLLGIGVKRQRKSLSQ